MKNLFERNGLIFWDEPSIRRREQLIQTISASIETILRTENRAFVMQRMESPILIPTNRLNPNYGTEDVFFTPFGPIGEFLALRPETTAGSYAWAEALSIAPPYCIWQAGKSFRREQDQPTKFMRLKEFYQLEFQVVYSIDSKNDYYLALLPKLLALCETIFPHRVFQLVKSDRLPSYSEITTDIEVKQEDRFMEICSISLRNDFKHKPNGKELRVTEIAFGLDRLIIL